MEADSLVNEKVFLHQMKAIQSTNQCIYNIKQNKKSLVSFILIKCISYMKVQSLQNKVFLPWSIRIKGNL